MFHRELNRHLLTLLDTAQRRAYLYQNIHVEYGSLASPYLSGTRLTRRLPIVDQCLSSAPSIDEYISRVNKHAMLSSNQFHIPSIETLPIVDQRMGLPLPLRGLVANVQGNRI